MIIDRATENGSVGRLPWQADDVDGITHIDERLDPGEFADVAVEEVVDDYDFRASLVARIAASPVKAPSTARRVLPLATIGSYGR
jgi:hypothetical protein